MTSIITGDVINSRKLNSKQWIGELKTFLSTHGKDPTNWEIYRGDQFQLETDATGALLTAIRIKACLKAIKVDVRLSIGVGEKNHKAEKITESNGSAFIRSGETFETLKKQKTTLAVNTGNAETDAELNLMIRFALTIIDNWLVQSAEYVMAATAHMQMSQEEMGQKLGINQAAVSRRRKRAHFDLMMELDAYYRRKIESL